MFLYSSVFKCPRCCWWALGIHSSQEQKTGEELAYAIFRAKCVAEDCCWSGEVAGSEGAKPIGKERISASVFEICTSA
jgi:hypothetical protein